MMNLSFLFFDIKRSLSISNCFIKLRSFSNSIKLKINTSSLLFSSDKDVYSISISFKNLTFDPASCQSLDAHFNDSKSEYTFNFKVSIIFEKELVEEIKQSKDEASKFRIAYCANCHANLIELDRFVEVMRHVPEHSLDISESIWCPCRHVHSTIDSESNNCFKDQLKNNYSNYEANDDILSKANPKLNASCNKCDGRMVRDSNSIKFVPLDNAFTLADSAFEIDKDKTQKQDFLNNKLIKINNLTKSNHSGDGLRTDDMNCEISSCIKTINDATPCSLEGNNQTFLKDEITFKSDAHDSIKRTRYLNSFTVNNRQNSVNSNNSVSHSLNTNRSQFFSVCIKENSIDLDYACLHDKCKLLDGKLLCKRCEFYLGQKLDIDNGNKAILKISQLNLDTFNPCNVSFHQITETLKEKFLNHDCSRFVLESLDENNKKIQCILLWLMDCDSIYYLYNKINKANEQKIIDSDVNKKEITIEPNKSVKVLYCPCFLDENNKILTRSWLFDFSVECLHMDFNSIFKLLQLLSRSTEALPKHLRRVNEFYVGYL